MFSSIELRSSSGEISTQLQKSLEIILGAKGAVLVPERSDRPWICSNEVTKVTIAINPITPVVTTVEITTMESNRGEVYQRTVFVQPKIDVFPDSNSPEVIIFTNEQDGLIDTATITKDRRPRFSRMLTPTRAVEERKETIHLGFPP